ncbi:uncharacterized protein [Primulina eburnea]|uniref:uncharacterized protein n=1 Tax=Primulina eburnea TaxID=1245227 RepID=UPI003C6C72C3
MSFYIALFFRSLESQKIMGSNNLNFAPILFLVPFYFFILLHTSVYGQDDVCKKIDCVRGTCVGNKSALLGFECICYPGWKQITLSDFTFPPCVIPDCKLDFHCGSSTPAPPPPPPPPSSFNILDPCNIAWCGDGTCQPDGISHSCRCFEGSANLLNMTVLPCFKKCGIGADCSGVDLDPHSASTPPPPSNGSKTTSRCSGPFCVLNFGLISTIILVSTFIGHTI